MSGAVCLTLIIAACNPFTRPEGAQLERLEQDIRTRALATEPGQTIDLRDLAPEFDWSELVIVGPYPDGDEFARVAGFDWNVGAVASTVDETNTIAFISDGHVAAWGLIRGDVYFLPEEDSSLLVPREEAIFRVVQEDDGESRRLDHVSPSQ
jgi:hypothetical protein